MSKLRLSLALSGYDHTRDLVDGTVAAPGIDVVAMQLTIEEIFHRLAHYRDFDVAEFSFAKYVATRSQGSTDIIAIPAFPSRMFRQSSVFLRADSPIRSPEELRGKRVGVPEWAQTAAVWSRSWLHHQVGVRYDEIDWVQAGVSRPGRREKVALQLPEGVRCTPQPNRSLTEMLLDGTLDAVLSAHPLEPFKKGTGEIVQLYRAGTREAEAAYLRETGLYPIMHVIVIRQSILDDHPWVAGNLFSAFEQAKANSLQRLKDINASRFPVPWLADHVQGVFEAFGGDPFPYGLEENRVTVDRFIQFAHEQGVVSKRLAPDDIFVEQTGSRFTL